MCEEQLDLEFRVGRVIFGPARGTRLAVLGHGEWIDGKEHEGLILAQCGDKGPFMQLQAHSNGLSVEPRAQGLDPRVDRFRAVLEHQKLSSLSASGLEADSVCGVSPVEAKKGRTCCRGLWLQG